MNIPESYADCLTMLDDTDPSASFGELLARRIAELATPDVRHPRLRSSAERQQLPKWLRLLVLRRDDFTCQWCDRYGGRLEVDHLIPWSVGGPDASWNLRTLCHDCNQQRSNYVSDTFRRRVMPIILSCGECGSVPEGDDEAWAWCAQCGCPSWVSVRFIDSSATIASMARNFGTAS